MQTTGEQSSNPKPERNWGLVIVGHSLVFALSPALALALYFAVAFGPRSLIKLNSDSVVAWGLMLFFAYLLFSMPVFLMVGAASPV